MCFCTICRNSCARQADSEKTLKMLNFHETMSWVFGFVGFVLVLYLSPTDPVAFPSAGSPRASVSPWICYASLLTRG